MEGSDGSDTWRDRVGRLFFSWALYPLMAFDQAPVPLYPTSSSSSSFQVASERRDVLGLIFCSGLACLM